MDSQSIPESLVAVQAAANARISEFVTIEYKYTTTGKLDRNAYGV